MRSLSKLRTEHAALYNAGAFLDAAPVAQFGQSKRFVALGRRFDSCRGHFSGKLSFNAFDYQRYHWSSYEALLSS